MKQPNILDVYASVRRPFIHGRGRPGTEHLLSLIPGKHPAKILEIGFGTGATLVKLISRFPGVDLEGLETSPAMYQRALNRLKFCRIKPEQIKLFLTHHADPFLTDKNYDVIYAESVFSLIPKRELDYLTFQIYHSLKPGGCLILNETIWLEDIAPDEIRTINHQCRKHLGIQQAHDTLLYAQDWIDFYESMGFHSIYIQKTRPCQPKGKTTIAEQLSHLYSLSGKVFSLFNPTFWKLNKNIRQTKKSYLPGKQYLESYIMKFEKPEIN